MTKPGNEKLTVTQAAARAGVRPKTWTAYVSRARKAAAEGRSRPSDVPLPDGEFDGRTPWWWDTTVDAWIRNRAGQGARTDLAEQDEAQMPVVVVVVDEATRYQPDPELDLVRKLIRDAVTARAEGDETLFRIAQAASLLTMDPGDVDPDEPSSLKE